MNRSSVLLTMAIGGSLLAFQMERGPEAPTLAEAEAIWMQHDFRGADEAFADVAASLDGRDRAAALRWRGLLAWRHFDDHEAGASLFDGALAVGVEISETWRERSRLERDRGRFDDAWRTSGEAIRTAETESNRLAAITQRLKVAIVEAEGKIATGGKTTLSPAVIARLVAAYRPVAVGIRANPSDLKLAAAGARAALLLGDGPGLLEAWWSYFVLIVGQEDAGVLGASRETLLRLLPDWDAGSATPDDVADVVVALGESALHREAWLATRLTAFSGNVDIGVARSAPRARELLAYAEFIEAARRLTDAFYLETSHEKPASGRVSEFRDEFVHLAEPLWDAIEWSGGPRELNQSNLKQVLDRRFGADLLTGRTAGYQDVHLGHRVIDDRLEVTQYGRTADLEFVSLDGMVSNGYQSWAWDYRSSHGGWAGANGVTQVRPGYAGTARELWRAINDPVELGRFEQAAAAETADDWDRAADDPYAYLPGLVKRLQLQGIRQFMNDLAKRGVTSADPEALEREFLVGIDRTIFESSIVAHEGRHAIDKRIGSRFSGSAMEFRAKLSQVVFATYPRLAMDGIMSGNIGDQTPHGQANLKAVKGVVAWMEAHAGEIEGFDEDRPTLPQFDRLTDEQIKAAFAAQDPLAELPG
jgi:hypothetical protein